MSTDEHRPIGAACPIGGLVLAVSAHEALCGVSLSCFLSDGHGGSRAWTQEHRREPVEQHRVALRQDDPQMVPAEYRVLPTCYTVSKASPEDNDLFELRVCWRGTNPETGADRRAAVADKGIVGLRRCRRLLDREAVRRARAPRAVRAWLVDQAAFAISLTRLSALRTAPKSRSYP